jgi:hypothetical protein
MAPGGIILIDDCDPGDFKGARIAADQFADNVQYRFGMGVISIPA